MLAMRPRARHAWPLSLSFPSFKNGDSDLHCITRLALSGVSPAEYRCHASVWVSRGCTVVV